VASISSQPEGDLWVDIRPDSQYSRLLSTGNPGNQNGVLVLELGSQDLGLGPLPLVGQHVTFVGPLVYDTEHYWNAIRPVWSITTN